MSAHVSNSEHPDTAVSRLATAIGEPARAKILYCLMDGRARTSTELATVAAVSPSTASVHLQRLKTERLIKVHVQGKHRYHSLEGPNVARVLEGLSFLAGGSRTEFVPNTPDRLRAARTCYDHIAGTIGVALHDRCRELGWLRVVANKKEHYELTPVGVKAFDKLGVPIAETLGLRRRFAFACLDWSERRPHIGGGLGAALLNIALQRKWVVQDLDSRALDVTNLGRREMLARLGVRL